MLAIALAIAECLFNYGVAPAIRVTCLAARITVDPPQALAISSPGKVTWAIEALTHSAGVPE